MFIPFMHFYSVEDIETIFCFELFQDITQFPYFNKYPEVDFLSSMLLAQSESG